MDEMTSVGSPALAPPAYAQAELQDLHPWACQPNDFRRFHIISDEQERAAYRSPYGRDKHRIVSSKAFRRLAHKTQVYLASRGNDHLRTRLTHTVEVQQIAKDMARYLRLNEDLVEAIAVGHDIGHAPFGHAGERQLNEFLCGVYPLPRVLTKNIPQWESVSRRPDIVGKVFGEFRHSYQSMRLLTWKNEYIPKQYGLNITFNVLEGILKHTQTDLRNGDAGYAFPDEFRDWLATRKHCWSSTAEGQVVAIADEIAQVAHDLSDAVILGVLSFEDLMKRNELHAAFDAARRIGTRGEARDLRRFRRWGRAANDHVAPIIISFFAQQAAKSISLALGEQGQLGRENPAARGWLVGPRSRTAGVEPYLGTDFEGLKHFKEDIVINNYTVNRMDNKGEYLLRQLFEVYIHDPRQLPDAALAKYLEMKRNDLAKLGSDGAFSWLRDTQNSFGLPEVTAGELARVRRLVESKSDDGAALRRLPRSLLKKLRLYLFWDGDYRRAIVDHIACMSDSFAEQEVEALYGQRTGAA